MKRTRISVSNNRTLHLDEAIDANILPSCRRKRSVRMHSGMRDQGRVCFLQENSWGRCFDFWGSHRKRETEIRKIPSELSTSR